MARASKFLEIFFQIYLIEEKGGLMMPVSPLEVCFQCSFIKAECELIQNTDSTYLLGLNGVFCDYYVVHLQIYWIYQGIGSKKVSLLALKVRSSGFRRSSRV